MTTSGVSAYNLDFDEIILEAYERCGLQVRDGYDARTAQRSLNLMFAEWSNRGLNLWTIEQREVVLTANVHEYDLPADTVDALSAVIRTNAGTSNQQDITIDRIGSAEYLHVHALAPCSVLRSAHGPRQAVLVSCPGCHAAVHLPLLRHPSHPGDWCVYEYGRHLFPIFAVPDCGPRLLPCNQEGS
jgi:hypothetical protein